MAADVSTKATHMAGQKLAIQANLARIERKVLVMSGKGGVGKTTVAVNLALALAFLKQRVGLMDIDLHGPSTAIMLGLKDRFQVKGGLLEPIPAAGGLKVASMAALLADQSTSVIWRGPKKIALIRQFLADVDWGELDELVIDSPPGTGDEPLAVAKGVPGVRAVVVTTPQLMSLADVRRSITFCRRVGLPVWGIVENMGPLACPNCGHPLALFGSGGGERLARETGVDFLGTIPFWPELVTAADAGRPLILEEPESVPARAFADLARRMIDTWPAERSLASL
jgi:ATP-binding protein involved in chromosome partitioning